MEISNNSTIDLSGTSMNQLCMWAPHVPMSNVEDHRIFLVYSLVYLLSLLYIIFLPFCTSFVSFLCLPDVYK